MRANVIINFAEGQRYAHLSTRCEKYGKPGVYTATTADHVHHDVTLDQVVRIADEGDYDDYLRLPDAMPTLVYVVTEAYSTRRTGETACNYDDYEIQPGVYPVVWTNSSGHEVDGIEDGDGRRAYYAKVVLDAVWTYSYYVNRLFSESRVSADSGERNEKTTYTITPYAYDAVTRLVEPGKKAGFTIVRPGREVYPPKA